MHDSQGSVRVALEQTDSGRATWIRKAVFTIVKGFWALLRDSSVDSIGAAEGATRGRAPDEGDTRSRYAKGVKNTLDDLAVRHDDDNTFIWILKTTKHS